MKLSQEIIFFQLQKKYAVQYLKKNDLKIVYNRPIFFDSQMDFCERTILVDSTDIEEIKKKPLAFINSLLFFFEKPDLQLKGYDLTMILIEEPIPIHVFFNELQEIFNLFDQWDDCLKELSYGNGSFQELIDHSDAVMDERMLLIDRKFHYAAFSKACELVFDPSLVDEHHNMPMDAVNDFISDSAFQELYERRDLFDYVSVTPTDVNEMICRNFFDEKGYAGRLIIVLISGNDEHLKNYIRTILNHLYGYVDRLYRKHRSFNMKKIALSSLREPLLNILHQLSNPAGQWERVSMENGWKNTHQLQLIQLRSHTAYTKNIYSEFLGAEIENQWPGSICMLFEEQLIMLINLDLSAATNKANFHQQLPYFLRDSLMVAGLSRIFFDINELRAAYEQTQIALDFGVGMASTNWIHHFDNYAFMHMLKNCTGTFLIHQVCDERLFALKKYDAEKNTEYYITLSVYFQCRLNAALAAKTLHIHRSSLLNRLARMKELFQIDFESDDALLYLGLSWLVIERHQYISGSNKK